MSVTLHAPDCPDAGKRGTGNCIVPSGYARPGADRHNCLSEGLTEYVVEVSCDCNAGLRYYPKGTGPDPAKCPVHGSTS